MRFIELVEPNDESVYIINTNEIRTARELLVNDEVCCEITFKDGTHAYAMGALFVLTFNLNK